MRITQIDAFSDSPFSGNPAAVCLLPEFPSDDWMQKMAGEMNLSETAFLVRQGDRFLLRWFTPRVEVDLCGHATLASAHFLWESGEIGPRDAALFQTASGPLSARRKGAWIEMDFPSEPAQPVEPPTSIIDALGAAPVYVGRNRIDFLIEVATENEVRNLKPDLTRLADQTARGVIVTSKSDHAEFDFVSRFFAPGVGVDEDPVTGSAHCCLGPYWSERLGADELTGYQASERGGVVRVRPRGDRIGIEGQAVTVFSAEVSAVPLTAAH